MHKIAELQILSNNRWIISTITLLVLILLLGGSSRDDVQSLLLLRPITIATSFFYAAMLTTEEWRRIRFLLIFIMLVFAALALQMIPLPPSLWQNLPGRDVVIAADRAAGLQTVWRPISLTPDRTTNALWAIFVPLSVLLSLAKVRSGASRTLAFTLAAMALVSAIIGVLQVTSGINSPLYFYDLASRGFAAGFFANRNHNAAFVACAIPLLFALGVTGRANSRVEKQRKWLFGFGILLCFGLVLAIGSRAGMFVALLALLALPLLAPERIDLFSHFRAWMKTLRGRMAAGAVLASVVAGTLLSLKTQSVARILSTDNSEARLIFWKPVIEMIGKYFPFGSGFGSFVEVYKMDETLSTLGPTYVNHAHNDFLEVLMTGGIIGGLLLALAFCAWGWALLGGRHRSFSGDLLIFRRTGALILLMLSIASLTDYPLRTPFLAALAIVAAVWMAGPLRSDHVHRPSLIE